MSSGPAIAEHPRPHGLSVSVDDADPCLLVLVGELDVASADDAYAAFDTCLAAGCRSVRADLSRLTFLDCAGLRAIIEAHNRLQNASGTLVLTGVGPRVAALLRVTCLDETLVVADG